MMYCLESNKGKEKETLEELLRVAIEYIVLAEPSYESGNEETKKRIKDLCCIECFNLYPVIHNIPILNLNNAILCSKYETGDFV